MNWAITKRLAAIEVDIRASDQPAGNSGIQRAAPLSGESLDAWHRFALTAEWSSIVDVRKTFPHADAVGRCTVFNIHGNRFRLIARILGIYTHKEYDEGKRKHGCESN